VELSCLTKLTRLGVFQFQGPAADVCPLTLPQVGALNGREDWAGHDCADLLESSTGLPASLKQL
jgi:hypothetical protein